MSKLQKNIEYQELVDRIGEVYQAAKKKVVSAVNTEMLHAYWEIGKYIIEYEQGGKLKAEYGKALLVNLSKDLSIRYGRGFSRSNLQYMRLLYQYYPICQTLSGKLSWSHYVELVSIDDNLAREFYEKQAILEDWTIRELQRQKKTGLFHRLAIGGLFCGNCLKNISYSKIPVEIGIKEWQQYYYRFFWNWCDSGIFEQDALDELTNYKKGKLNREGERIRGELSKYFKRPVYIRYFVEEPYNDAFCRICEGDGIDSGLKVLSKICENCNTIFD